MSFKTSGASSITDAAIERETGISRYILQQYSNAELHVSRPEGSRKPRSDRISVESSQGQHVKLFVEEMCAYSSSMRAVHREFSDEEQQIRLRTQAWRPFYATYSKWLVQQRHSPALLVQLSKFIELCPNNLRFVHPKSCVCEICMR